MFTFAAYRHFKQYFFRLLEDPESRSRDYTNTVMMGVVLLSVGIMILEADPDAHEVDRALFRELDLIFLSIFVVEYVLRLWVVTDFFGDFEYDYLRDRRRHLRRFPVMSVLHALGFAVMRKVRWILQPFSLVDLLAIVPLFRPLRLIQVLRLLKLFRYSKRLSFFTSIMRERSYELISLSLVGLVVWGVVALAFYMTERGINPGVDSFWSAVYWAVITIATVGYGDITPVTPVGQGIAMIGVLMGMWVPVFMTTITVSVLMERIVFLREHRMERQIEHLFDHYIVCGLDVLGQAVCRTLVAEGKKFVGVEDNPQRLEIAMREGWIAIKGDITQEETWRRLGIKRARGVICTIPDEAANVYVILMVREAHPDCFIVACGTSRDSEKRLLRVGANRVISPYEIGGMQMAHTALRPTALQFFDLALKRENIELEMEELQIPVGSHYHGIALKDSSIRQEFNNVIVVGVVPQSAGGIVFNPKADTLLHAGDILVCMGHMDDLERLKKALKERV